MCHSAHVLDVVEAHAFNENCPVNENFDYNALTARNVRETQASKGTIDDAFSKPPSLVGTELYEFCVALNDCGVNVRSVVNPFGYSETDFESEIGTLGIRSTLVTLALINICCTYLPILLLSHNRQLGMW
jgi:hypothetical protein